MSELKSCPFCGSMPKVFGEKVNAQYADGEWIETEITTYFVQPFCLPWCPYGNVHARAFGVVGGTRYTTSEAAIKAWNRRAENDR